MSRMHATALGAFLMATTGLTAPAFAQSSSDIPLALVSLGSGNTAYQRLIVTVGVAGGAPHPYLFDTGSALFNLPQSFVPTTTSTLSTGASYTYGDGNGYYGNLSQVPSVAFYQYGATSAAATPSLTLAPTGGYTVNEVTTHLLGNNPGGNAATINVVTDSLTPKVATTFYVDPNYPNGVSGVPPIEGAIYGTFGAGDFAPIIGNGIVPGSSTTPASFQKVQVGSILGQSVTSGYVVAANATQTTQTATTCSPCVILGLTPQLRAQFTSYAPWATGAGNTSTFPGSGANGSTEFGVTFTYSAVVNGVTVTWTGASLLDAGTQNLNLHTSNNVSAIETTVANYVNAGVQVTMTSSVPGSGTVVFTAADKKTAPLTNQINLTNSSVTETPGIAWFLAESTMYDLANQKTFYSPNFVTDAAIPTSLTVNASDGPLGLAGAISDAAPGTPSSLTLNAAASVTLSATNTYTGPTTIAGASATAPAAQLIVTGPGSISSSSLVTVNGTLDLSGVAVSQLPSPGPSGVTLTGLAGSGQVSLGGQALTLTNATGTFSGTIADGGIAGGSGASLTIAGGTQKLTGVNSYTGGTTIANGATLAVNSDAALGAATAPLTINSGTLLALGNITSTRPVTITSLGGTINAGAYQVMFNGPFTTNGDLTSIGSVIHAGTSTVGGNLTLGDGQLNADGDLTATNITVNPTATLRGSGTVTANTTVLGTLAPGDSPGTLTHKGKLTLTPGSTTQFDIDGTGTGKGAGNYSRVIVKGAGNVFTLAGTLRPLLRGLTGSSGNTYVPPLGQSFNVIASEGGIAGSFAGLRQPDGLAAGTRFDALYSPSTVTLVVTPASYASLGALGMGQNANQAAVGMALDGARPIAGVAMTPAQAALYTPLYVSNPARLGVTLSQLSPAIAGDNLLVARDTAAMVRSAIGEQMEARRGAEAGPQAQSAPTPWGGTVWLDGLGQFDHVNNGAAPGFSGTVGGTAVGVDFNPRPGMTAGVAFAFAQADAQDTGGGRLSTDGVHVSLYGTARMGMWFADAQAGGGFFETSTWRQLSAFGATAQGNTNGSLVDGSLRAGLHLDVADGWQIEPSLRLGGAAIQQDGFGEAQGGAAALAVSRADLGSVESLFSVRVERRFAIGGGMTLVPNVRLGWAHEFAADTAASFASLTSVASTAFASRTAPIGRDRAEIGVGASLRLTPRAELFASYDGALGARGTTQDVTGGFRLTW